MPKRCALGCPPRKASTHQFPNYVKHAETFKAWVRLLGGKLNSNEDYEYYKNKRICDIHFSLEDRNRYRRLNCLAVPSLFLPSWAVKSTETTNDVIDAPTSTKPIVTIVESIENVAEDTPSSDMLQDTHHIDSNMLQHIHKTDSDILQYIQKTDSDTIQHTHKTDPDMLQHIHKTDSNMIQHTHNTDPDMLLHIHKTDSDMLRHTNKTGSDMLQYTHKTESDMLQTSTSAYCTTDPSRDHNYSKKIIRNVEIVLKKHVAREEITKLILDQKKSYENEINKLKKRLQRSRTQTRHFKAKLLVAEKLITKMMDKTLDI